MKTNQMYLSLALVAAFAAVALGGGALSSAQAVPLTCSPGTITVSTGQQATFIANGGTGTYVWSGTNLTIANATGAQFTASYPVAGTYTISVTSGGQTANCQMVVTASSGTLACAPVTQNVFLGQNAVFTATGGNGSYLWSSPSLTITTSTGSQFTANFASTGTHTATVTSNGQTATCTANVVLSSSGGTPGLPNTGGGGAAE